MANIVTPKSYKADIPRALHNLYCERSTTLHPMTAVPIYFRRLFRGDKVDFGILESVLRSEPTFAPLLSNWRLEFQWYFDSDANRYGWIDNNTRLTAEEVMNRRHHTFSFNTLDSMKFSGGVEFPISEYFEKGVQAHSVTEYSGVPVGFMYGIDNSEYEKTLNVDFHLTYLNIIRNYHVNRQYPNIPYVGSLRPYRDGQTINTNLTPFYSYSLEDLDNLFIFLRSCPNGVNFKAVEVVSSSSISTYTDAPVDLVNYYSDAVGAFCQYLGASLKYCGGLFCTQYEPDLYANLLNSDQGLLRSMASITEIDGEQGVTIETFRLANHLQGLYDKIFVSGGTDRDLSRTIWGIESNRDYDIPELLCVHSEIIGTNLVESNNVGNGTYNGIDVESTPGSMSGNLNTRRGKGRMQKFTAKTAGNLMCIVTLTPIVSYYQNIERYLLENDFMSEFTPDMARKGFENLPMSDYCALPIVETMSVDGGAPVYIPTSYPLDQVVGKQVAWLREMTAVNRVYGEFANNGEKRDWHLLRSYISELTENISDGEVIRVEQSVNISPYGNPLAYQYPFVSQTLEDPNFMLQCAIYNKAYRPIPRRFMPNLGY